MITSPTLTQVSIICIFLIILHSASPSFWCLSFAAIYDLDSRVILRKVIQAQDIIYTVESLMLQCPLRLHVYAAMERLKKSNFSNLFLAIRVAQSNFILIIIRPNTLLYSGSFILQLLSLWVFYISLNISMLNTARFTESSQKDCWLHPEIHTLCEKLAYHWIL